MCAAATTLGGPWLGEVQGRFREGSSFTWWLGEVQRFDVHR